MNVGAYDWLLLSIHSYLCHVNEELFRLSNDNQDNNRFCSMPEEEAEAPMKDKGKEENEETEPEEEEEEKKTEEGSGTRRKRNNNKQESQQEEKKGNNNEPLKLNLGVSVLQWLSFAEQSNFKELLSEVVGNSESPYFKKAKKLKQFMDNECELFVSSPSNSERFQLHEIVAMKLYTDTDSYQSKLRRAFWKGDKYKALKMRFYQWALLLYCCMLYGGRPISVNMKLFHGLNQTFVVDEFVPIYFGPFSTSKQINVAKLFSEMKGQVWLIQSTNGKRKSRFVLAIAVSWLSKYKNEDEWLLLNTPLPISHTKTFMDEDKDLEKRIDLFLSQLRNVKHKINKRQQFMMRTE